MEENICPDNVQFLEEPAMVAVRRIILPKCVDRRNSIRMSKQLSVEAVETPLRKQHTSTAMPKAENIDKVQVEAVQRRNDECYSTLKIGNYAVKIKLDTGAKRNVLPQSLHV